MKKITLFIAVIAAAGFTSCKKDRTCTCTTTSTVTTVISSPAGSTSSTDTDVDTDVVEYTKARKGDARAACASYTQNYTETKKNGSITTTSTYDDKADCKLK